MKKLAGLFTGLLVSAFILAGIAAGPAMAQDKAKDAKAAPAAKAEKGKAVQKVLLENDKFRVTETTWKPGDDSANVARPVRVARALKGGTLTRIYPDGKTEKDTYKTGEVKSFPATPPYVIKNTGKTVLVLYTVSLK